MKGKAKAMMVLFPLLLLISSSDLSLFPHVFVIGDAQVGKREEPLEEEPQPGEPDSEIDMDLWEEAESSPMEEASWEEEQPSEEESSEVPPEEEPPATEPPEKEPGQQEEQEASEEQTGEEEPSDLYEEESPSEEPQPQPEESGEAQEEPAHLEDMEQLGNWTNYNGIIFGDATIYQSQSGGGLAVGGSVSVRSNFRVGSTYSSQYDPALHIGEYKNEEGHPALVLAGETLTVSPEVTSLDVFGGAIAISRDLMEVNGEQPTGFTPGTDSYYLTVDDDLLDDWFAYQYKIARASSRLMLMANDTTVDITQLSDGSYAREGPAPYRNRYFEVDGEVHENALFITVRSGSDLNLGQWWPVHSIIQLDVNWAIDSDLVVFNFPDAVNVTMNSSAFQIEGAEHWSTTVDAWVGERGMEERLALTEKVVYNFPNARSIETQQALIQGTILAPDASFTGIGHGEAGHIYGHIVAGNYVAQGNFTIHAFRLSPWVFDLVEDELSRQRDTGAIRLRHYLYFGGEPTSIRTQGGDFLLENQEGLYYDGAGAFTASSAEAAVYTTDPEGYTTIQQVPLGEYTLVKVSAPEGFVLNNNDPDNPHTYARFDLRVEAPGETVDAVRYSEPAFTDLHFQKVNGETGQGLSGAVFTIVREADEYGDATVGETYTSDEDGLFTSNNVPAGSYHLVEISPPPGHSLVAGGEVRFLVLWDEEAGGLGVYTPEGEPLSATAQDPLPIPNQGGGALNTVMLIKYARETAAFDTVYTLGEAHFSLYRLEHGRWEQVHRDATGQELQIITNEFGYCRLDNLPDGEYRLVETVAPPGFALTNTHRDEADEETFPGGFAYQFTFSDAISFYTAYLPSDPLAVEITVELSGMLLGQRQPLSGAAFRLEQLLDDGVTWEERFHSALTDETGLLPLERLTADSYRLTQLQPSRGFSMLEPAEILFTVAFDEAENPVVEAVFNGGAVAGDSGPVGLEQGEGGFRLLIDNQPQLCGYLVYKMDADYQAATDEEGGTTYTVTYLEGAELRLRRRLSARTPWEDYGGVFISRLQYDEEGQPLLDSYGNHIAAARFDGGLLQGEYQLVETQPPEGFHTNSSVEVVLGDGTTGRQLHLFTVTEAMAGAAEELTYSAPNYADAHSMPFRFQLVDSRNYTGPLAGGLFALYHCEEDHLHSDTLTGDACWSRSTPVTATSGADGVVRFEDLASGDYLLSQDQAPPGYRLPSALWLVHVNAGGEEITIELLHGTTPAFAKSYNNQWLLPNWRLLSLPGTGGRGRAPFAGWGLAVVLVWACLMIRRMRTTNDKLSR